VSWASLGQIGGIKRRPHDRHEAADPTLKPRQTPPDQHTAADDRQKAADTSPNGRRNPSDRHLLADDRHEAADTGPNGRQNPSDRHFAADCYRRNAAVQARTPRKRLTVKVEDEPST